MDHLSNGYSSSSASNSPHENNSESDGADDFHVISVSHASNSPSQTQKAAATGRVASQNGRETSFQVDDAKVSKSQLKKIEHWIAFVETSTPEGQSFAEIVRRNKNFRNPAIFEKMISYCGIDEFGTNFKGRIPLQEGDFYTDIREAQDTCMDASISSH